ncbi:MAG: MBL fold metallo-hydrolase [Deferrisomatales bacterium]|nr:MBL fold metallo-hydrolase [Deferrisomatales bacterium]
MEIVPLGVGEAFAKTLFQTNFLVRPAEGAPFLVDAGHTASRALRALGVDLREAARVLVSHLHGDHVGGLEELGFTGYFVWGERPVLHVPRNLLRGLWDHTLRAGMGQRHPRPGGGFFAADVETYFDVRPVGAGEPFDLGSVQVIPFATPHVPGRPSWGFRLQDRATGGAALLTCDSRLHRRNLERFGAGCGAIFHDCQLTASGAPVHATLDELLGLPDGHQERILLVHYGDDWRDHRGRTGRLRFAREGETYRF